MMDDLKVSDPYDIDYQLRDVPSGVDELFFKRWSPRSFKKGNIPDYKLRIIFEAARFAPSCSNEQPWIFVTSSNELEFDLFLKLLDEKNQIWARNASLLGFIMARNQFKDSKRDNRWALFDCGAAWMSLTLQARILGLYTHGMAGIKKKKIYQVLNISGEIYTVICGFVIGILDKPDKLPEDLLIRERPSSRIPLDKIWFKGISNLNLKS